MHFRITELDKAAEGYYNLYREQRYKVRQSLCISFCFWGAVFVYKQNIAEALERTPVIAATDSAGWQRALMSETEVLFHLNADIMTVAEDIKRAKAKNKYIFVHIDLAEGIGKDRAGIKWLSALGADGIISTSAQLIRSAKEFGLTAVQRFFVLDTKGMKSISEMIETGGADIFLDCLYS